jgi:hypothetical protein
MPWLLIITVVLLVAVFLFMPVPPGPTSASPSGLDDFQIPDNSSSRVVPLIYGTTYIKGNCIYYANLTNKPIYQDTPDKK